MQTENKHHQTSKATQPAPTTARSAQSAPSTAQHGQTSSQPAYMSDTQFPTHDALSHIYNGSY